MARKPRERQRRPEQQNVVLQEQAPESEIEPMDVALGIVLMFMIPAGVWILLLVVGFPVNGNPPMSAEERLVRKEKKEKRKPPPLDESEYKIRSDRVDDLLNRYIPKYRSLSHKEEEPVPKHYYYECAQKCLQKAETELKELQVAFDLERSYTKDQILEAYMNEIYMGRGNMYGFQNAANRYLGKNATDLNVAEAALLAALSRSASRRRGNTWLNTHCPARRGWACWRCV